MKEKKQMSDKGRKLLAIVIIGILILAEVAIMYFVGKPLVQFVSQPEQFRAWIDSRGWMGRLAYMGMVFFQVLIAIIPGEPFEMVGGYAFGAIEGTILCTIASAAGSMVVFFLVRKFGIKLVEIFYSKEKLQSLRFLRASKKRDFLYLIIFMIPGTPKDLLCYFAGLTDIRPLVWLMICSVGRLPAIITSTIGGDALGEQSYGSAIIVFVIAMALSGFGIWVYNIIQKKHEAKLASVEGEQSDADSEIAE